MNNSYIKIKMNKNQRFNAVLKVLYNDTEEVIINNATIDTGCNHSHFSANVLLGIPVGDTEEKQNELKIILENAKRKALDLYTFNIGTGVESNGKNIERPKSIKDAIQNKHLKFKEKFDNVEINGLNIGTYSVSVSYDTLDIALIGMDFLKDWDIHIGTVNNENLPENNQTIFLACPKDSINTEYLLELERLFGIGTTINSALINNKINTDN